MYIDCMVFEYPHNEFNVIFSFGLLTGDLSEWFCGSRGEGGKKIDEYGHVYRLYDFQILS